MDIHNANALWRVKCMVKPNSKSKQMLIASGNLKGKDQRTKGKQKREGRKVESRLKAESQCHKLFKRKNELIPEHVFTCPSVDVPYTNVRY